MILLVDIGNSRTKWALASTGDAVLNEFGVIGAGQEAALAEVLGEIAQPKKITEVVVSAVGAAGRFDALSSALHSGGMPGARVLKTECSWRGLQNGYRDPARLGVDRWLAMVAAWSVCRAPCLVVDAGTALTVDAIGADGLHLGGYIVPGIELQIRALALGTAQVQPGTRAIDGLDFGRTTADAVSLGVRKALAALVERSLVELRASVDDTCACFLTGGDGKEVASFVDAPVILDEHLVFKGMLASISP